MARIRLMLKFFHGLIDAMTFHVTVRYNFRYIKDYLPIMLANIIGKYKIGSSVILPSSCYLLFSEKIRE